MALGGWLGTDPAPTLEQFKLIVEKSEVSYFIWQQDLMDLQQLGSDTVKISEWVSENFRYRIVGGAKIYDFEW